MLIVTIHHTQLGFKDLEILSFFWYAHLFLIVSKVLLVCSSCLLITMSSRCHHVVITFFWVFVCSSCYNWTTKYNLLCSSLCSSCYHRITTRFKVLNSTYFISSIFNFFCFIPTYFYLLSFLLTFHVLSSLFHHESIATTNGL